MSSIDRHSPTWKMVERHINERIERVRDDLEKVSDEALTMQRRGRIKELRELLELPDKHFSHPAE